MGLVWIVTTGNSDVKLLTDKGYSTLKDNEIKRKLLGSWYTKDLLAKVNKDDWTLPARFTGIVYGDAIATHFHVLKFPLLDGFCNQLVKSDKKPDRIIILLTDQENIFEMDDRSDPDSPYWKDTCTLQPIFEHYFRSKYDVNVSVKSVLLSPKVSEIGLDNWNATLSLVQNTLANLTINEDDFVIVSHQAGTPAISSAVQFASLSSFGGKVSFLTSNERTGVASLDPSSSYFESMQIQEAQKLLQNYNYVGVESVLKERLEVDDREAKNILALLEVAKLWNLSKFDDDFKGKMKSLDIEDLRESAISRFNEPWAWWIAYEEAYLAVVRRKQGNIVEAFFHSFRAFEGIFAEWGKKTFNSYIDFNRDVPYLNADVLNDPQDYLSGSKLKDVRETIKKDGGIDLELMTLCKIFKVKRSDYKQKCPDLITFWDNEREKRISARRNFIFHQVQGINEGQLLNFWQVDSTKEVKKQIKDWENKILNFLNFIADEQKFENWKEASLMARVHDELEKAIESLEA
jgi:hypothetical protein